MVVDLVYVMTLQAKPSAELLPPFGQMLLRHTHPDRPIVGHHSHAHLDHGALQTFVAHLTCTARHQRRNMTFYHRTAVTTGTGQLHLVWRADAVEPRGVEEVQNLLRAWRWVDRFHRGGNPH